MWATRFVTLLLGAGTLGFLLGVQAYSLPATEAVRARLEAQRAAAEAARAAAEANFVARARAAYEQQRLEAQKAAREAALAALPGDPKRGRMTFMTCMGCHGLHGEGMRAFSTPRLAGQHPWYLRRQLHKFQAGLRGSDPHDLQGAQMAPMAKLLASEAAVDNVIAYIARVEVAKPAARLQGDVARGKELFAVCATCHGRDAGGLEAQKAPRLNDQHGYYLERQLRNFRNGIRGRDAHDLEGKMMVPIAQSLPDEAAIRDVIAYIQSLGGK